MIRFNVIINSGNEYIGAEGKTITVQENVVTVDNRALARQINLHNPLLPVSLLLAMIEEFVPAVCDLMALGYAVQLKYNNEAMIRFSPDVKVNTDTNNINLERAQQLDSSVIEINAENAPALVDKTGVTVRASVRSTNCFTTYFNSLKAPTSRDKVIERSKVTRPDGDSVNQDVPVDTSTNTVDTSTGSGSDNGGSDLPPGNG